MRAKKKSQQKKGNKTEEMRPLARYLARKLPSGALDTKRVGPGKYQDLKQQTYKGLRKAAGMFNDNEASPTKEQLREWKQACKNIR